MTVTSAVADSCQVKKKNVGEPLVFVQCWSMGKQEGFITKQVFLYSCYVSGTFVNMILTYPKTFCLEPS